MKRFNPLQSNADYLEELHGFDLYGSYIMLHRPNTRVCRVTIYVISNHNITSKSILRSGSAL